jgi:putative Ca2+/H+ antiporter (TMEM165/GDT1 family)
MSSVPFWELVVIAALAQLTVLPGEKVQFIIAGLSTRFHPLVVVAAAGSAFAGWTVVEIYAGSLVQGALSPFWLDAFTGAMFLLFAVLLVRSAPAPGTIVGEGDAVDTDGGTGPANVDDGTTSVESDGRASSVESDGGMLGASGIDDVTVLGREVPSPLGGFLPIFAMMATGEFGDKTQIITVTLAAKYGARPGIWVGEMLVIIPVSLANAYFFYTFSHRFNARKAHFAGAAVFAFFAFDTALSLAVGVSLWEEFVAFATTTLTAVV